MSSGLPDSDGRRYEDCTECSSETPHVVRIELRIEGESSRNPEYSREPYRVVTCQDCGHDRAIRMNNA